MKSVSHQVKLDLFHGQGFDAVCLKIFYNKAIVDY